MASRGKEGFSGSKKEEARRGKKEKAVTEGGSRVTKKREGKALFLSWQFDKERK